MWMTLFVLMSIIPWEPYLAEWPRLSALLSTNYNRWFTLIQKCLLWMFPHIYDGWLKIFALVIMKCSSLMHAMFRYFRRCSDLVGVDPLKRIAADKRILPAGISFMNCWLFHFHLCPQWWHSCLVLMNFPICWATSPLQCWWHDLHSVKRLNRWEKNTKYLTSSWGKGTSVSSLKCHKCDHVQFLNSLLSSIFLLTNIK